MIKYSGIYESPNPPKDVKALWVCDGTMRLFNGKTWEVIGEQENIKVKAENIEGQIKSYQISSVPGSKIDAVDGKIVFDIPGSHITSGVLGSGVAANAYNLTGSMLNPNIKVYGSSIENGSNIRDIAAFNVNNVSGCSNVGSLASGTFVLVSAGSAIQKVTLAELKSYINT